MFSFVHVFGMESIDDGGFKKIRCGAPHHCVLMLLLPPVLYLPQVIVRLDANTSHLAVAI
jgi:hypothetical protein